MNAWEDRGCRGFRGLDRPQFGDPDYDETKLAIRVDCMEGDERQMDREIVDSPMQHLYIG